ncbi:GTPase-activating protein skywalker isoform X1 [Hyalella azteca]|uniref:GTPase-activating protein skywalker isoform X1 n=1 Tax=Hyalella azteca TaxID=294128 RepID=A0A979FIA4_HYAAZ|nr:GTPase-activating protein skywalker isoform X1 [Hyalella azteca]
MFSYDMIAYIYPRAFAASRGFKLTHHGWTSSLSSTSSQASTRTPRSLLRRHEVHSPQYAHGSRLSSVHCQSSDPADEPDESQGLWSSVEDLAGLSHEDAPNSHTFRRSYRPSSSSRLKAHAVPNHSSANITNSRARRSTRNSSRRNRSKNSNALHMKAVDQFIAEAQARDINSEDLVSCATALINERLQAIKNEELVLDWSSPADFADESVPKILACEESLPAEPIRASLPSDVQSRNCTNARGIPAAAFPPSLIKWPGLNSNKQKRLVEIKKQVKFLSNIIKMTIEGSQELQQSGGLGGAIPAPFSPFVDVSCIPSSALTHASADAAYLPSIEELNELLLSGKEKEAKSLMRGAGGSVTCPARPALWKELCKRQTSEQFSDSFYYDTLLQIYGTKELNECQVVLPMFVDQKHLGRALNSDGVAACARVISVLAYYYPPITHAPLLYPLTATLLLYMKESDVYNSLSALVCSAKVTFATQTKIAHEVGWRTTLVLARKHVGAAFSTLEKFGIDSKQVEVAFQNWLWWIFEGLPLPHLIRVVDCFLLEGWKVLMRVALAIFHMFMRQVTRDPSTAAALSTRGFNEALLRYCHAITASPAKLLKTAFGIRALSKAEIQKVMLKTEHSLKRHGTVSETAEGATSTHENMTGMNRAVSLEGLPNASSQADVQMVSRTLNLKEGTPQAPRTRALGDFPIRHLVSKIASMDELLTIWNWIPVRMTMYQPSLLYTTEEHGSSLTTFYQRVENHEPTILLVRTTCDHVFGAYCSVAWNNRNKRDEFGNKQTYYGTGETFLFSLRPVPAKHQWVGITQQKHNAALSSVQHSAELFMHGDEDMITVGGGDGQGLFLDHELQFGKTEKCLTFDNPPLCPTGDFEIKVVEVYGIDVTNA